MLKLIKTATIIFSLTFVFISVIFVNPLDWAKAEETIQTTQTGFNDGKDESQNIYTIELNLLSVAEVEKAREAGIRNPETGLQCKRVERFVLDNLSKNGLDFKIVRDPVEFTARKMDRSHQTSNFDNSNMVITAVPEQDSLALVAFYNSTNGPGWEHNDNWLSANPVSTWFGVAVSGGRVTELNLYNNQLSGTIPSQIGDLTNLRHLYLEENQLNGSIPQQIGNLTNLVSLGLSRNQLSGSIPSQIGNLTNLISSSLSDNQLSGAIPPQIGNLTNLLGLYFYNNQLSDLPDLSHLSSLDELYAQRNRFTFEDIEPNVGIPDFPYSPQAKVGRTENITKAVGSSVTFSVTVGGTANQYQWYRNGFGIIGATSSEYTINGLDFGHAGSYTCVITNTIATELSLFSHPKNLTVVEAPTSITVTSPNGGETWQVGTAYDITWESDKYNGEVKIEISTTAGSTWWDVTQGSNTENDGSYSYTPVPENISNHCLFKVESTADPAVKDQSDQEFSIVGSSGTPLLGVDPASLDFGTTLSSLSLQITNRGGGTLNWQVAENPNKPWISSINPASGTNNGTVTVTVDRSQLSGNSDTGTLLVTSNGGTQTIPVQISKEISGNLVINGDFSDGDTGWEFKVFESAQATGSVVNGEYFVSITNGGTENWHIQLSQSGLLIENGKKYMVSFEAYTTGSRTIMTVLNKGWEGEWIGYNLQSFALTMEKRKYKYEFKMNHPTDQNAVFNFDVGNSTENVYIDNVVIREKVITGNLTNGDFSNGDEYWLTWISPEASAYGSVQNGEYILSIDNGGNVSWYVQLIQTDLFIEKGKKYTLSFDAYAQGPRTIGVSVQHNGEPWTIYHSQWDLKLTSVWQTYRSAFTMNDSTDLESRLMFECGLSALDVHFDNIVLKEADSNEPINQNIFDKPLTNEAEAALPTAYGLLQSHPNPFNLETTIGYHLSQPAEVVLTIYNSQGHEVRRLVHHNHAAGIHFTRWDGRDETGQVVASGLYFYRLEARPTEASQPPFVEMKKMILMK